LFLPLHLSFIFLSRSRRLVVGNEDEPTDSGPDGIFGGAIGPSDVLRKTVCRE
jgi:hypothetical protein